MYPSPLLILRSQSTRGKELPPRAKKDEQVYQPKTAVQRKIPRHLIQFGRLGRGRPPIKTTIASGDIDGSGTSAIYAAPMPPISSIYPAVDLAVGIQPEVT